MSNGDKCLCGDKETWHKKCYAEQAEASSLSDLLCATTCVAEKGGDLCCGECAKEKIKTLFKYLDSFEYENDVVTVAGVKQSLDQST